MEEGELPCNSHNFASYVHFQGLKTGMYYLRTRPAANAIQFTVDQKAINEARVQRRASTKDNEKQKDEEKQAAAIACSLQNREACVMCSA